MSMWGYPKGSHIVIGIDLASPGGDYGVTTVYVKPSRFRNLCRRIGLDKSTWKLKLVEVKQHGK